MSNIGMQSANAILAINSLDRYITTTTDIQTNIEADWLLAAPTTLNLISGNALVGATLYHVGDGFPLGVVTIVSVVGTVITINTPVTANSGGPIVLTQIFLVDNATQPRSNALVGQYRNLPPYCNNFTITSPGALIYGYIDKIVVSQIQVQYNIPTVCFGRNDTLVIEWTIGTTQNIQAITIPFGFYSPDDLAAAVQALITSSPTLGFLQMVVSFDIRDGYTFTSNNGTNFSFAGPDVLIDNAYTTSQINRVLKTYRLFGMNFENSEITAQSTQISFEFPNFLYTPYIDIYSDVLTNYQNVKDTNTSTAKPKGLIARVLLSGVGNPQYTTGSAALGTTPFVMTADLNSPKVIQWSRDVAVPSIDFQLRDCYGEFIPGDIERYPTEFQMTLLCIEG